MPGMHVKSCRECEVELDRLSATHTALRMLPDEGMPQRIGFVSDRVFEPSPVRRWWAAFWGSAARLGFASAAMLSMAVMVSALHRPTPITQVVSERKVQPVDYSRQIQEAVKQAVAETETREAKKTAALLAASEKRHEIEHKNLLLMVQDDFTLMQKRLNFMTVASNDLGPSR